jgi:hypothetical protein
MASEGIGAAARTVAERVRAIVGLELELARVELRKKAAAMGAGLALAVGAVLVALFGLGFLLAAAALGLAEVLEPWLAVLAIGGGLIVLAGLLAAGALSALKTATPPVPEQALEEARRTAESLRSDGHR